jgi:hypothetical protein
MSFPTIVLGPKDPRRRSAPRDTLPGFVRWARTKTAKGWYWVVRLVEPPEWDDQAIGDGFAATEEAATAAARDLIVSRWPTGRVAIYQGRDATESYRERHARKTKHKDWRTALKGTAWETRVYIYHAGWALPITNVTDRFVYVLNPAVPEVLKMLWAGPGAQFDAGRFTRKDCLRLDRLELEAEGMTWRRGSYSAFYLERAQPRDHASEPEANPADRIRELRAIMQREHPDKGGDRERFIAAQKELARIREARP